MGLLSLNSLASLRALKGKHKYWFKDLIKLRMSNILSAKLFWTTRTKCIASKYKLLFMDAMMWRSLCSSRG